MTARRSFPRSTGRLLCLAATLLSPALALAEDAPKKDGVSASAFAAAFTANMKNYGQDVTLDCDWKLQGGCVHDFGNHAVELWVFARNERLSRIQVNVDGTSLADAGPVIEAGKIVCATALSTLVKTDASDKIEEAFKLAKTSGQSDSTVLGIGVSVIADPAYPLATCKLRVDTP